MDPTCVESRFDMNNKIDIEAVAFVSDNFYEEPCVWTPLLLAVEFGRTALVKLLLDRGADAESKSSNRFPLVIAAEKGHWNIAELLLEGGADMESQDSFCEGMTALLSAIHGNHEDMI
jgi:ankyrin repeat protein